MVGHNKWLLSDAPRLALRCAAKTSVMHNVRIKVRTKRRTLGGKLNTQEVRHGGNHSNQRAQTKSPRLLALLAEDLYRKAPPFEKLIGDLAGAYSRRINFQHRLVYQVPEGERVVKVLRLWSHYE